jgi:hypothetical protein
MTASEKAMREILAQTQYLLRKDNDQFRLKTILNEQLPRYEVQVLMGRKEFEEVYVFEHADLLNDNYCQMYYDQWYGAIKKNLKLNERMWR